MMNKDMRKLYVDSKKGQYYYQGYPECDKCNNKITCRFILQEDWSRTKEPMFHRFCLHCISKIHSIYDVQKRTMVFCKKIIPKNAGPYLPQPPVLINKNGLSTFEIVYAPSEAEVIDNTIHAGRINYNLIREIEENKKLAKKRIEELDSEVSLNYINKIRNNQPLISEEKKRLLK